MVACVVSGRLRIDLRSLGLGCLCLRAALGAFLYRLAELRVSAFMVARVLWGVHAWACGLYCYGACSCSCGFRALKCRLAEFCVRALVAARAALGCVGVGLRSLGLVRLRWIARLDHFGVYG